MAVSAPPTTRHPQEKMEEAFSHARQQGNGWWLNPDNPRFGWLEKENGDIVIHPLTGRSAESILAGAGLKFADLYATKGQYSKQAKRDTLDLVTLSYYFKIPHEYLLSLGYRDGYPYHGKCVVKLGGYGEHPKAKLRLSLGGDGRFRWDGNTPGKPIACGLDRLDEARRAGWLALGEGESDAATMWFHGFPYLGVSGAQAVKSLDVSQLADIPTVYILVEPDQVRKAQETGKDFYASMRAHLRENGYTGAIFAIYFYQATGQKDPSALHKDLWDTCDIEEPAPFLSTIKAKFAEAIEKAIAAALPEGNEEVEEDESPDMAPALLASEGERLRWFTQLCAVPANVMSPAHKIVLMVIILHGWRVDSGPWWQLDTDYLSEQAGMAKKTFLTHLAYLTKKLGLFQKRAPRIPYTTANGQTKYRRELYIQPAPKAWLAYPSTYHLQDGTADRKHGGTPPPQEEMQHEMMPDACELCGSKDVIPYAAFCKPCDHATYPPIEWEEEKAQSAPVESTAVVLPLVQVEIPITPNLGILNKESTENTQVGGYRAPTPSLDTFTQGDPCASCSCELYRPMGPDIVCVRCCPPRGGYPVDIDTLYPRKESIVVSLARHRERRGASPGKVLAPDVPGQLFQGV